MKLFPFILFLTIVLLVYFFINFFVFQHLTKLFHVFPCILPWLKGFLWLVMVAYPLGRMLVQSGYSPLPVFLVRVGSYWLGFMFYFFLTFLAGDFLLFLAGTMMKYVAHSQMNEIIRTGVRWFAFATTLVVVLIAIVHYQNLQVRRFEVKSDKALPGNKPLKIAMASDIHLGYMNGKQRLEKIVRIINNENPDIVIFAGDMVDESARYVVSNHLGEPLLFLECKEKLAITGNHEFISGLQASVEYYQKLGIQWLMDEIYNYKGYVQIVGRIDRDGKRFGNIQRTSDEQLYKKLNPKKWIVWLDHQPPDFKKLKNLGIDLSISGHTHHGQLWPLNYITKAIYKHSYGMYQTGKQYFYVSCGAGGWGPPMRIGSTPEIVIFTLTHS